VLRRAALAIRREDAPPLSADAMLAAGDLLEELARFSDGYPGLTQVKAAADDLARTILGTPADLPVTRLWPPDARGVATHARNSLLRAGHKTARDVAACAAADLLDIRNFGHGQLREVRRVLAAAGLALKGEVAP
jgi:hypothetical protein